MSKILDIRDLHMSFYTEAGVVKAVDGVSFGVDAGEVVGVVGESGCGKTALSLTILQLLPSPPARVDGGEILFNGRNLLELGGSEIRKIRGNEIAMVFQEPMTSLNPVFTIGDQLTEAIRLHQGVTHNEARNRGIEMLRMVGIPRADEVIDEYPHRFSGGMRQRAMIAMALSCNPKLLIADEPTTALDVTIQAQILELMLELKQRINTAIMFITHDLSVIAEMADRVVVMYAGKIVEQGDVVTIFHDPQHPYTRGLIGSRPSIETEQDRLVYIPGNVPSPLELPSGCPFHPRCRDAMQICAREMPPERELQPGHKAACWLHEERSDRDSESLHTAEAYTGERAQS